MPFNPVRDAITGGKFCYMVELVASAKMEESKIFDIGSALAGIPGVIAASVTSYAGGSAGHDPIRIATGIKERGLTPNVHMTCVQRDRVESRKALEELATLGIENVFAITGDYPPGSTTGFDLDSVQLIEMIQEMREKMGLPFFMGCAVSPFKYTEADCVYQYLKLEKKVAAGADYAITQLGYDFKKYRELLRYISERNLKTPVMGNVYVLPAGAAKKFAKGEPPGCWVSPELLEKVQDEAKAEDKGVATRLERAARMVAALRGLNFAGAYIGGEHGAARIQWIIKRSEEIAGNWEEYAEEITYGKKDGFYLYESKPEPKSLGALPKFIDTMAEWFPVKHENTGLRKFLTGIMRWVDKHPAMSHTLEKLELAGKKPIFGCQACGNCVLGELQYVCPMTCPKNLRNGPCGGTLNGSCEVHPDKPCIWVQVYDNAKAANRVDELRVFIPARNRSLQGTSSFVNLFLERDYRPGHAPPLIQIDPAPKIAKVE